MCLLCFSYLDMYLFEQLKVMQCMMIITRSRGDLSDAVDPLEGRGGVRG